MVYVTYKKSKIHFRDLIQLGGCPVLNLRHMNVAAENATNGLCQNLKPQQLLLQTSLRSGQWPTHTPHMLANGALISLYV